MANGDNLAIGGMKDLSLATSGIDGAGISTAPQTLPNTEYNTARANKAAFNTGFLSLTAQHTTARFNSTNFDFTFGTTSGLNPNAKLEPHQGNKFHSIG